MKFNYYDAINRVERPALSVTWISLLTEDEEMVSRLGLREYQTRFGPAQLKLGGIDGVGTREEHRNKGYSRRVMEHTISFMNENGFHLETPQDKLIQPMMGRRSIEDLAIEPDVSVSEDIIPVLDPLFPLGHPHVWWSDRF